MERVSLIQHWSIFMSLKKIYKESEFPLPDYLELWLAEDRGDRILALVRDHRRSYEEGEVYQIEIIKEQ
jgi:hypothetical protein